MLKKKKEKQSQMFLKARLKLGLGRRREAAFPASFLMVSCPAEVRWQGLTVHRLAGSHLLIHEARLLRKKVLFKRIYYYVEDNCFTVLCWFLPYINMNQPKVYTCPLPLACPSHPIPAL